MTAPRQAIIAFGSNLGKRRQNLARALQLLDSLPQTEIIALSPLYETAPVGLLDQPPFLNGAAAIETAFPPKTVLKQLLSIEKEIGRTRTIRWGPRTIDLDLLFYENEILETENLTLPHPRWRERTFVIIPLRNLLESSVLRNENWNSLRRELKNLPREDPDVREIPKTSNRWWK